jgi:hypothetical protein
MTEAATAAACRVCREPLKAGATKCLACDSYQGWQRFLGFSSSILALAIALISVLQVALPVFINVARGAYSDASLRLMKTDGNLLRFVATNAGNRPAVVADGTIALTVAGEEESLPLEGGGGLGLIEPGAMKEITLGLEESWTSQLISFAAEGSAPPPATSRQTATLVSHRPMLAEVRVGTVQFNGEETRFTFPVWVHCGGSACHLRMNSPRRGSPASPAKGT